LDARTDINHTLVLRKVLDKEYWNTLTSLTLSRSVREKESSFQAAQEMAQINVKIPEIQEI